MSYFSVRTFWWLLVPLRVKANSLQIPVWSGLCLPLWSHLLLHPPSSPSPTHSLSNFFAIPWTHLASSWLRAYISAVSSVWRASLPQIFVWLTFFRSLLSCHPAGETFPVHCMPQVDLGWVSSGPQDSEVTSDSYSSLRYSWALSSSIRLGSDNLWNFFYLNKFWSRDSGKCSTF